MSDTSFEKNMKRLEEIVDAMEKDDLSLDDSLKLFQEGMSVGRDCKKKLAEIEMKVNEVVSASEDGTVQTERRDG